MESNRGNRVRNKAQKGRFISRQISSGNRVRLTVGFGFILFLMVMLIFRMGYWQIIRADGLKILASDIQTVDTTIEPARGSIYDANGGVLAESVVKYELYAYTQYLYKDSTINTADRNKLISDMTNITGKSNKEIKKIFEGEENLVLVADGLTREAVNEAKKKWEGLVQIRTKTSRYYPNGAFASQVLGGVNASNVGLTGLEYEYNSILAGVKGRSLRVTDINGNTVTGKKSSENKAQDGRSIKTTIDPVIQNFVEDALKSSMKSTGAEAIACIVMNPKTGDIMAMAYTPEYDPNTPNEPYTKAEKEAFSKMSTEEQTNYLSRMWSAIGISDIYEPGSTFKLITSASALETGNSRSGAVYKCNGSIKVGSTRLHCLGHHGKQTLTEAVGNSCNPGLATMALDMGADTFYGCIDIFGFNDRTGIDLPGEGYSIVKDSEGMGNVDLATTGYGQGIAVSPIQMLTAISSFGNGGVMMKPKLVKEIIDSDGKVSEIVDDTEIRQVVSESTANKMCEIMEYVVSEGGGKAAYVPGFRVGGKTGTADFVEGGSYNSNLNNLSFVAMAPMDDPQVSMLCIVYKPTKKFSSFDTTGPIVAEVMEKTLTYLGVERKYSKKEKAEASKGLV